MPRQVTETEMLARGRAMTLSTSQTTTIQTAAVQMLYGLTRPGAYSEALVPGHGRAHKGSARALARMGFLAPVDGSMESYTLTNAGLVACATFLQDEIERHRLDAEPHVTHPAPGLQAMAKEILAGCEIASDRLAAARKPAGALIALVEIAEEEEYEAYAEYGVGSF